MKGLLEYCLTDGQKELGALDYLPVPAETLAKVKAAIQNIKLGKKAT